MKLDYYTWEQTIKGEKAKDAKQETYRFIHRAYKLSMTTSLKNQQTTCSASKIQHQPYKFIV